MVICLFINYSCSDGICGGVYLVYVMVFLNVIVFGVCYSGIEIFGWVYWCIGCFGIVVYRND